MVLLRQPGCVYRDSFEAVDNEVQRLAARKRFYAIAPKRLFVVASHSRQKSLRQNRSVFDQICCVKHQTAPPRFAMQNCQTMRQT